MVRLIIPLVFFASTLVVSAPVALEKRCFGECLTRNDNSSSNWTTSYTDASTSNYNSV